MGWRQAVFDVWEMMPLVDPNWTMALDKFLSTQTCSSLRTAEAEDARARQRV
jgi:hypothetical protein